MLLPWACRRCGAQAENLEILPMNTDFLSREYYRQGRPPPPAWPASDPPPEVLSTDGVAQEVPRAVKGLQRAAESAGWVVRVGYSRSQERAVKVGTYKVTEAFGLYTDLAHGVRISAVYSRTVGAKIWTWRNTAIWPIRVPGMGSRFVDATVSDLQEFVAVRGSVLPAWFKGVHARVHDAAARAKARAKTAGKPKEGSS
jgi:hypothetical protein